MKLFPSRNKVVNQTTNEVVKNAKKGSRPSQSVNAPTPDRVTMEMGTLRNNIDLAKDPINPSYYELYRMYENTMSDAEVITQRRIAENKLKAESFVIRKDGNDNEELKKLFDKPWFDKFREFLISEELFGYRLVEFGQFDEDGQFIDCKLFPLYNVYPFNKNIIIDETDTEGIPYSNFDTTKGDLINPYDLFLIELGDPQELGLLFPLTREAIIKGFSRRDWNEHSEKWGQPGIVIKTDAEGGELNAIEAGARNFGRNNYSIIGAEDEFNAIQAQNNGSGYLIYDKNIDKSDAYIAKIINGQYGTGNEKSFVGTAEVAERILDDFMKARLRRAANIINYELIPFLIHWGYPLEGTSLHFPRLEDSVLIPLDANDPEIDEDDQKSKDGKKVNRLAGKKKTPW